MDEIVITIKRIALIAVSVGALTLLSSAINNLLRWEQLTKIFIILRNSVSLVDFIIDTNTLMLLIGFTFTIEVALWGYRGITWIIKRLNE